MNGERTALFDCLYRRTGELTSHLGRYDMQVMALSWMLTEEPVLRELFDEWSMDRRIEVVARLMRARALPDQFPSTLLDIHQEMEPVLARQKLSPSHPAVITQIGFARPWMPETRAAGADWFNRTETISKDEINGSIAALERDIMTAVKLYLSLATLSSRVEQTLHERRDTPPPSLRVVTAN